MPPVYPQIIILTGPEENKTFTLPSNQNVTLGRGPENNVVLSDSSVSRKQATIFGREGKHFIKDENSRNGTILEGRRLVGEDEHPLQHLDEFSAGIYEILYVEKNYTEAELAAKRQKAPRKPEPPASFDKSLTGKHIPGVNPPKESGEKEAQNKPEPAPSPETIQAESLIDEILEEKKNVETRIATNRPLKKILLPILIIVSLLAAISGSALYFKKDIKKLLFRWRTGTLFNHNDDETDFTNIDKTPSDNDSKNVRSNNKRNVKPDPKQSKTTTPTKPLQPQIVEPVIKTKQTQADNDIIVRDPVVLITPSSTSDILTFNVFIDVTTEPLPAVIYFEDERLGVAPVKSNIKVEPDKIYSLYADYELRDINDIYRKKVLFKAKPDSDLIEINVKAEIGQLRIQKLPRRVEFYLEGYYDYDKLKANPAKLSDIIYGKPVYLPYGEYLVELREQMTVAGSDNLISKIRYQRKFTIDAENSEIDLSVTDRDLRFFPAVIKSDPSNADVYRDDEKLGTTPFKGELPVGKTRIKIVKDGYFEKFIDIEMDMNSIYETTVVLETSKIGELLNKAKELKHAGQNDQAMSVLIEALKYGGSSREKAEVYYLLAEGYFTQNSFTQAEPYYEKAKSHPDVELRAVIGLAKTYNALKNDSRAMLAIVQALVNIKPDTPPPVRAEANAVFKKISPIKSVIYIYTEPDGANIYLNDKKLTQQTPTILSELGLGNYRIEIEKPGYQTYKTKQSLKLGEFVVVKVKLTKEVL